MISWSWLAQTPVSTYMRWGRLTKIAVVRVSFS